MFFLACYCSFAPGRRELYQIYLYFRILFLIHGGGDARRQMKHEKRTEINLNLFYGVGNFSPSHTENTRKWRRKEK